MKILFKTLLALLVSTSIAGAYTSSKGVFSTNGSSSDVQAAINAAAAGNTVTVPAGSFSGWNISISTPIVLQGAGQGSTTIEGNGENAVLSVNATSSAARITGFTFDGGTTQSILVQFSGNSPELVDHCTFIGGDASEMIHNMGMGPSDTSGWTVDVIPGSANALYIEDCTFTKNPQADQYFWGTSAIESYYGSRTVIRYCTFNYCQIDQHGNTGLVGARWWEFYDNTFYVPANGNQSNFFALRGGSGVVFSNHMTGGPNAGGGSIELYSDNTNNPPTDGPGAGIFINGGPSYTVLSPAYLWGNDSTMPVTSGSSNIIQGRDYFVSSTQPASMNISETAAQAAKGGSTYSYVPYVYPHPLASGASPSAPTNLRVAN
jgi:hypothetical protein